MMKIDNIRKKTKGNLIPIICILLTLMFAASAFIISPNWNSRLSLAFTAIASLSTVATLIIAIKLYDRWGLKNEFVIKQAEKIFELFDILLNQTIVAEGSGMQSMIRANLQQLRLFHNAPLFLIDAHKKIFISKENYEDFYQQINPIRQSYWLPREIQQALDFLIISALATDEYDLNKHIKVKFSGPVVPGEYKLVAYPDLTIGDFVMNMINLIEQIDKWLKKHSQVEISLTPRY